MKKRTGMALLSAAVLLTAAGCGAEESATTNIRIEHPHTLVYTWDAPEYTGYTCKSVADLTAEADFIGRIQVQTSEASYDAASGTIRTTVTGSAVERYKGSYDGEAIELCGGYLPYQAYVDASGTTPDTTAAPGEGSEVYCNFMDLYVPQEQDEVIVFCRLNAEGVLEIAGGYQGIFQCVDKYGVINQALIMSGADGAEPLAADLMGKYLAFIQRTEGNTDAEKDCILGMETERLKAAISLNK